MKTNLIGGGFKKVLYTLNTVRRIGVKKSAKALHAKNTCKACGLGMGGQQGGMTNEVGEFPSVCNKSVQAQLTDIQAAIPLDIFQHSLADFKALSAHEIENLGRLNTPLFKAKGSDYFTPMSWQQAIDYIVDKLSSTLPERSFFYSSGRSSNEAAFVLQLMARMYGSGNINNCSYYCHQATGVGLTSTIGGGTATVELADLALCDLIFVIGANPASNHPRFIHQLKKCRDRGGHVIVINPAKEPGLVKFAVPKQASSLLKGGDWIASEYIQPNISTDLLLLKGIAKALLEQAQHDGAYIEQYTQGFEEYLADIKASPWQDIVRISGVERQEIVNIAGYYARSENTVFAWGMGVTHHRHGVENVEAIANLALLRGMIGKVGAGLLPLRGHSNVQGIGSMGVKPVLADEVLLKLEQHFNIKLAKNTGMDTLACLQAAARGGIDFALLMGGNLYAGSPDSRWAEKALDKIACKVFLTTTLNLGHIYGNDSGESLILPVTARDEEPQPTTQESMFNYVRLSDGGIERLTNVRSEVAILADIASGLLPDQGVNFSTFKQHKTLRQAISVIVPGMEGLADIDVAKQEFHVKNRLKHKPEFATKSNKAQFIVHRLPWLITKATLSIDNHFILMTVRSEGQFNSIIYEQKDSYRNIPQRWSVMMNTKDMAKLALVDEDLVTIRSDVGEMLAVKVYAFDLPERNIMAYYPEANILVNQDVDPQSKTPAFKSVIVKVIAN